MPQFGDRAEKVITGYVQPNVTLNKMKEIHLRFTEEEENFGRWSQAVDEYKNRDWDEEEYEEFLRICRESVEGDIDRISEAFLDIIEPEDPPSVENITESLDAHEAESIENTQREGFQYRVRDDEITATYYYYTSDIDITEDLRLEELPNQKRIPLRFVPRKELVIVETTEPAKVQKAKATINDKTMLTVDITGNLNLVQDQAEEMVQSYIDAFRGDET